MCKSCFKIISFSSMESELSFDSEDSEINSTSIEHARQLTVYEYDMKSRKENSRTALSQLDSNFVT